MNPPKTKPAKPARTPKPKLLGTWPANQWLVGQDEVDMAVAPVPVQPLTFEARPQRLTVDLARSALVVVDMQNDFCTPGGWLDSLGADLSPNRAPIKPLTRLIPALRRAGMPVIWLNWGNRADLLNLTPGDLHICTPAGQGIGFGDPLPGSGAKVLEKDSWAACVVDELEQKPKDIRVDKHRMSGFWGTQLDPILRNIGVNCLLFSGVNTDVCVMTTLQDAQFNGYGCVMIEDCCGTTNPQFCADAAVWQVENIYGFVSDSHEIMSGLKGN
ncbi:MAG: cysteine hydrolase family protein [Pseudomonadota bacterium]|nr:cysteine hydrolase family protein [Pseudomonadota bacterium]